MLNGEKKQNIKKWSLHVKNAAVQIKLILIN